MNQVESYMATPTLRALSKLINMYYFFKIGYDAGLANDLQVYLLSEEEFIALRDLLREKK